MCCAFFHVFPRRRVFAFGLSNLGMMPCITNRASGRCSLISFTTFIILATTFFSLHLSTKRSLVPIMMNQIFGLRLSMRPFCTCHNKLGPCIVNAKQKLMRIHNRRSSCSQNSLYSQYFLPFQMLFLQTFLPAIW